MFGAKHTVPNLSLLDYPQSILDLIVKCDDVPKRCSR